MGISRNDINAYTLSLFLAGIFSLVFGFSYFDFNGRWIEFIIITILIILLELFPVKLLSGDEYSGGSIGSLYLLFKFGFAVCAIEFCLSTLLYYIYSTKSIRNINWFRYFVTVGMYFISTGAAYLLLLTTNINHIFISLFLAVITLEFTNTLLLAGISHTIKGDPLFHNFANKLKELIIPVIITLIVLPRFITIQDVDILIQEVIYAAFFLIVIIYFTNSYFKKIRDLEELNVSFERFVPKEFLQFLQRNTIKEVELGDQTEAEMTILFSDIRSFTTLSEQITPEENFRFLNSYLSQMEPIVKQNYGFIDKYIGDAIMALFHGCADDAVSAGISMLEKLKIYNEGRRRAGYVPIHIGIGINTGSMMLGIVGGKDRIDGTVISDAVNLASRMESLNKEYGTSLLISEQTYVKLKRNFDIRWIDKVKVKGKYQDVLVYEVFEADPPEIREAKRSTLPLFHEAIHLYFEGKYTDAMEKFQECASFHPEDRMVKMYIERCLSAGQQPK